MALALLALPVALEQPRLILGLDAGAGVAHREHDLLRRACCRRGDDLCPDIVSAVPDELMQGLWRELWHDSHEMRHIHRDCQGSPAPTANGRFVTGLFRVQFAL